ncbi:MAG: F0F1 ATP synthase subunit delta [Jatrophihabitans sp.]|nr:MAG: F0F1 ATP synthase subunit delta [Jatrophihabitans sp.]
MMRSASRAASIAIRPAKHSAIDRQPSREALLVVADDLYGVAEVLVRQPRLRRILGDPATDPDGRATLLTDLLGARIGDAALQIGQAIVRARWSSPWDMTDAFETAGDDAMFAGAEMVGTLDEIVDELFRFERVLDANSELTTLLDEPSVDPDRRVGLLRGVLQGRAHPVTEALLTHSLHSQRKRSLTLAIDDLLEEAAARQERSLARVISAVPLTQEQCDRLAGTLSHMYGRAISVRTAVAPAVRGGLIIRIGDEVIDGSIAARLLKARAGLAAQASMADISTRLTRQGKH